MSRKQSGNDFFIKKCVFEPPTKSDRDSSGRSFQICGPTFRKARLPTVDMRHHKTVSADRTERSAARQVGGANEKFKVSRRLNISQGSVSAHLRCGEMFNDHSIGNYLQSVRLCQCQFHEIFREIFMKYFKNFTMKYGCRLYSSLHATKEVNQLKVSVYYHA